MQGLDLGTADIGAMQTMQVPAPVRESDPVQSAGSTESKDTTESFRAALRNEMSAEAAASQQSNLQQSAGETTAQTASRSKAGDKTMEAGAVTQTEAAEGGAKAGIGATVPIGVAVDTTWDKGSVAKAGSPTGAAATRTDASTTLAKSAVDKAARADAAAIARTTANLAVAGEKAIAPAKAKHGAQPVEVSDSPTAKADAAPVTLAAVPVVAVAAPVLAVQPKPGDEAGSDADSGSVAAAGTKRVRRALANQIEAGVAKTANAKAAQADGQAADAGTTACASKDAKLAAVAEAGQAIAAAVASQAQTHATGLQPAADALAGIAVQGAGVAVAGSSGGGHTHDGVSAANGAVVSGGAGASLPAHQILSAGPTQLEVGVMDGTHGWLQIRAELGAGGAISTSLTGSAAAHAPLQQSVPEMTSYLASESVSVSAIAVHKASETAGTMAWGQGQSDGQAGGSGTDGGGGSPTHDGKAAMDGASGGSSGSRGGSPAHDGGAVMDGEPGPIGLGWMGGVSPAVFASGFSSGTSLAAGTGSWLSVRV